MNSDKQGRAMCACGGSSGAAPGAEPAAAAPQCRCRTAPRAPSPAQNITAAIAAADLTGTGFLRLRSFAASNAQPVPDVIVTISQRSGTGIPDKTVTTGPEALSDDVAIACPPRSYSLDENNRTVLPYAVVDGTDPIAVYEAMKVAMEHARSGQGPYLVEAKVYRYQGHYCGDPAVYRPKEYMEQALKNDGIMKLGKRLLEAGATQEELDAVKSAAEAEMDEAVKFADESPYPDPATVLDDMYVTDNERCVAR